MAPFDDLPIPPVGSATRVGPVLRSQRVGAIHLSPGVVTPLGQRLVAAWQRRKNRPGEPEAAAAPQEGAETLLAPEAEPPETYGEHGELLHPHELADAEAPRLDLEG